MFLERSFEELVTMAIPQSIESGFPTGVLFIYLFFSLDASLQPVRLF